MASQGGLSFEESELINWIIKMQKLSHPINLSQCHLNVANTPFTKGILGMGMSKVVEN